MKRIKLLFYEWILNIILDDYPSTGLNGEMTRSLTRIIAYIHNERMRHVGKHYKIS